MTTDTAERVEALRTKTKRAEGVAISLAKASLERAGRDVRSTLAALDGDDPDGHPVDLSCAYIDRARADLADAAKQLRRVQSGRDSLAVVAALFHEPNRI